MKGVIKEVPAFKIAQYPVTNAQYQLFWDATDGYVDIAWWGYSEAAKHWRIKHFIPDATLYTGDDLPRTNISWYDAVAYCHWLSHKLGIKVILPTEYQWRRAAEGSDNRPYPWGHNFEWRYCNSSVKALARTTTPVMLHKLGRSQDGVWDMSGNVWEWCVTQYDSEICNLTGKQARIVKGGGVEYPE
ncbi:MAG TPA: SUMF1/EgtB/PvdO family nonheme iron enzyme [Oculatellaceae cyanobacterium]